MYCVIQKVENKKFNPYGAHKELKVTSTTWTINGETRTKYSYCYGSERFERPVKDAYKISIHKSYRENGKIKKKQWVICTMGYYDFLEFWPGDRITHSALQSKLTEIGISESELWEMVYKKLDPIIGQIKKEFEISEEYKGQKKHEAILQEYRNNKYKFEEKYGTDTYDYCYDIFGVLKNDKYLKELKVMYELKQEQQRSYYDNFKSNYNYNNQDSYSSYFNIKQSNYTEDERKMLKKIYKTLAMNYHPDKCKDDGEMMKLINKLKEEWKV